MKAHLYGAVSAGLEGEEMYHFYCVPEVGLHVRAQFVGGYMAIIGDAGEGEWRVIGKCDSISCQALELDERAIEALQKARLPKRQRKTRNYLHKESKCS